MDVSVVCVDDSCYNKASFHAFSEQVSSLIRALELLAANSVIVVTKQ